MKLIKAKYVEKIIPGKTADILAVERSMRRDTPPWIRIGKRIYYDVDALQEWVEKHRVAPGPETRP